MKNFYHENHKRDFLTIKSVIYKYHFKKKINITSLMDLKDKYLTNIDTIKGQYGYGYQIDIKNHIIYSKAPDGKTTYKDKNKRIKSMNINDPYVADDIFIEYVIPEFLNKATSEVSQ